MSMNVNIVMKNQSFNQTPASSSKVSKKETNTFAKMLQTSSNQGAEVKPEKLDLEGKFKQLQQLITRLQLTNQPIVKLDGDKLSQELTELMQNLPSELQKKLEELLDNAGTYGDLLNLVKQDLSEVNLLALTLAIAGNQNQFTQADKTTQQLATPNGKANQNTGFITATNDVVNGDQEKLLKIVKELLQQQPVQAKTESADKGNAFKKFIENNTLLGKTIVGIKGVNQSQSQKTETVGKQENVQNLGTVQFPLSQQAQYKLHVTPEKVADNRFINELQGIIQSGKLVTMKNGETQFQIKLFPDHLGKLDITIIQKHGELLAKIVANSQGAKDLIESQLHQLKHAFQGQNIQVDKIEIQHQRFESAYQQQQQDSNNGKNQQQRNNSNPFANEHDNELESENFSTLLNEMNAAL